MSAFALGSEGPPGGPSGKPFAWPADRDCVRLPKGPISEALVRAVQRGGRGLGAEPAPVVLMDHGDADGERPSPVCPLTLDVVLVALDLLQRGGGVAPLNARAVLARKGYRRWGRERQAFERKVVAQVRLLQRFTLHGEEGVQSLLTVGPRNVARTDFILRAAPALAAELQRNGWIDVDSAVLRLDHRRNRGADALAKKLAVAIVQVGSSGSFRIADLLARAGHVPQAAPGDRPDQVAGRLPAALRRLRALGLFDIRGLEALEHPKGVKRDWLSTEIRIHRRAEAGGLPAAQPLVPVTLALGAPDGRDDGQTCRRAGGAQVRRGRPRFEPSSEQRLLVRTLHARGATRQEIARAVGVSLPTLRRYFAMDFRHADVLAEVRDRPPWPTVGDARPSDIAASSARGRGR